MDERLDPFDREMMRSDRRYRRRLNPPKLSWRTVGCLTVIVALLLGCVFSRYAVDALTGQIQAWRHPPPTPRPPVRVIAPPPTPPIAIITPQPGNKTSADHTPCPVAPG